MKKKGEYGYRSFQKKKLGLYVGLGLIGIIGLVVYGYMINKTRLNWYSFAAILFCLPVANFVVSLMTRFPFSSISKESYEELEESIVHYPYLYDCILTDKSHILPLDVVMVKDHVICGYSNMKKDSYADLENMIRIRIEQVKKEKMTVKIFSDYSQFYTRAKELQKKEMGKNRRWNEDIQSVLLSMSM